MKIFRSVHVLKCPKTDLSEKTIKIIERYGDWMSALANGDIPPSTKAQKRFIEVHQGYEAPESIYEEAWFEYRSECIYHAAKRLESTFDGTPECSYEYLYDIFSMLGRTNHLKSLEWLINEGVTSFSGLDRRMPLGDINVDSSVLPRSSGANIVTETTLAHSSPNDDWSCSFDDMDAGDWNDLFISPDDSMI